MTWTLQWILWNWHLFLLFLKDTKKRDIATLGRSSNAIQKPLLYGSTHVPPSSVHIPGLTVPLTLSALFADFSWCLLGLFPFGSVPTSLSLMTVHSLFRSAFLADFALSLPPFPKNLLPQNSCKIDKSFPFRPAHIRRHGARTVTVKRGRADRDNFPNVTYSVVATTLSEMFTPGSE